MSWNLAPGSVYRISKRALKNCYQPSMFQKWSLTLRIWQISSDFWSLENLASKINNSFSRSGGLVHCHVHHARVEILFDLYLHVTSRKAQLTTMATLSLPFFLSWPRRFLGPYHSFSCSFHEKDIWICPTLNNVFPATTSCRPSFSYWRFHAHVLCRSSRIETIIACHGLRSAAGSRCWSRCRIPTSG